MTDSSPADPARRGVAKQFFVGRHLRSVRLTGPGSAKQTEHHEISLEQAAVTYRPGDALGVHPSNDPRLVEAIVRHLHATGSEPVVDNHGETTTLFDALATRCSLSSPTRKLLELVAARGGSDLEVLLHAHNTAGLKEYVGGRQAHDVLDVLEEHPSVAVTPQELVSTLRSLLPRLYSIASSQRMHPDAVHVLVVSVSFELRGRRRTGVASTWLNSRWHTESTARLYIQDQQKHFAMPADGSTPLIMIGPGTGVAPFRAFLQERRASGAAGANWLFFGEQHRASDFFYEAEFTEYVRDGFLRLDTAFSRDQEQKIYVQHRLREHAGEVWRWLERGAAIYVCGDKEHMAADVDRELHSLIERAGGLTPDAATAYVDALKASHRYQRDVY